MPLRHLGKPGCIDLVLQPHGAPRLQPAVCDILCAHPDALNRSAHQSHPESAISAALKRAKGAIGASGAGRITRARCATKAKSAKCETKATGARSANSLEGRAKGKAEKRMEGAYGSVVSVKGAKDEDVPALDALASPALDVLNSMPYHRLPGDISRIKGRGESDRSGESHSAALPICCQHL